MPASKKVSKGCSLLRNWADSHPDIESRGGVVGAAGGRQAQRLEQAPPQRAQQGAAGGAGEAAVLPSLADMALQGGVQVAAAVVNLALVKLPSMQLGEAVKPGRNSREGR